MIKDKKRYHNAMQESGRPKTNNDYIREIALWLADEYGKTKIKNREYTYEYGYSDKALERVHKDDAIALDAAYEDLANKQSAIGALQRLGVIKAINEDSKELDDGSEIEMVHMLIDEDSLLEYVAKINPESRLEYVEVLISPNGISVKGQAKLHYGINGTRKAAVIKMFKRQPDGLSAKAWATLVGKPVVSASQAVNSDVRSINAIFKKKLQLDNDLIVYRGGYTLNFEELDIQLEE